MTRGFVAGLFLLVVFAVAPAWAQTANQLVVGGAPPGSEPSIQANGVDTNISILLTPKGTGGVGIGTTSPLASLDLSQTTDGILMPRSGTDPTCNATTSVGMVRYNTTTTTFEGCDGTGWYDFGGALGTFDKGTAAAPGWAVTQDTTTGLFQAASTTLSIATEGTEAARFLRTASAVDYLTFTGAAASTTAAVTIGAAGTDTSVSISLTPKGSGYTLLNGYVGIGTTSPTDALDVVGSIGFPTTSTTTAPTTGFYLAYNYGQIGVQSYAHREAVFDGVDDRVFLGCGTNDNANDFLTADACYNGSLGKSAISSVTFRNNSSNAAAGTAFYLANNTSNTEVSMTLLSGGNSPANQFTFQSTGAFIIDTPNVSTASTAASAINITAGNATGTGGTSNGGNIVITSGTSTNGTAGNIQLLNGNVGIGTTAPRSGVILDLGNNTTSLLLPTGTTNQRPTGIAGMMRFNSSTSSFEGYDGSNWYDFGSGIDTFAAGSAAAPGLAVETDATTGLFQATSTTLSIATEGTEAARFLRTASAVDYLTLTGVATGGAATGPVLAVAGTDTNVGLSLTAKGTGYLTVNANGTYGIYNNNTASGGIALYGEADTGAGIGVEGTTSSTTANATGVKGIASGVTGATYGVYGSNTSTGTAYAVYGTQTGASGTTYGVYGSDASASGFGAYGTNSASGGVGVEGVANTGAAIGVEGSTSSTTTAAKGMYGHSSGTSGTNYGMYGDNASASGFGVYGTNSASGGVGVEGEADTGAAYGVYGVTTSTTIGAKAVYGHASDYHAVGVYGDNTGGGSIAVEGFETGGGIAVVGMVGDQSVFGGVGVLGRTNSTTTGSMGTEGSSINAVGSTYGIYGSAASTGTGTGVYGDEVGASNTGYAGYFNNAATSGTNYGVYTLNSSTGGYGGSFWASAGTGSTYGIYAESDSTGGEAGKFDAGASSGTTYGIYSVNASTGGYAGEFWASAGTGITYGVNAESDSTSGQAGRFYAAASSGTTYGVYGTDASGSGYGGYFTNTSTGWALSATGTSYFNGSVGIGTATPRTGVILDLGANTTSLLLPTGTTNQRPTGIAGMLRYNSTLQQIEAYYNSVWNALSSPNVQVFTTAGANTYTWSAAYTHIAVLICGAGGGGGGGGKSNFTLYIAAGGGGGGCQYAVFEGSDIGANQTVTIGTGGTAGAGNATTGANGSPGGNSTFGSFLTGYGGGGGGSGSSGTGGQGGDLYAAGVTASSAQNDFGGAGTYSASAMTTLTPRSRYAGAGGSSPGGGFYNSEFGGPGGGSGGSTEGGTNASTPGGQSLGCQTAPSAGATNASTNGGPGGSTAASLNYFPGCGGGGGGGSSTANGGAGGAGTSAGGGGGGGGTSTGTTGGGGGAGGNGYAVIRSW